MGSARVEPSDDSLCRIELTQGDPKASHQPSRHNDESRSRVNLDAIDFHGSNVPCEVQGSLMLPPHLHVFGDKINESHVGRSLETFAVIILLNALDMDCKCLGIG